MAEDEVAAPAEASPVRAPSDLKRKLEELEAAKEFEEGNTESSPNHDHPDSTALESEKADVEGVEAKRPKLDVNESDDGLGNQNGFDSSKFVEGEIEGAQETKVENEPSIQVPTQEASQEADKQEPAKDNMHIPSEEGLQETDKDKPIKDGILIPSEGAHLETDQQEEMAEDYSVKEASQDNNNTPCFEKTSEEGTVMPSQDGEGLASDAQTTSRKIEVPNDKVGVLIGKGGDTIRYLQYNSGAKIQITRDAEADPSSTLRSVELIGTLSSIDKAEKLINAVMAEADAGGSPSLVARGLPSAPSSGGGEQLEIQVPNEKVGLIIGRGGDTIKGLQAKSGARIQLIPQHLPEGDGSRERIVRVTGDKKQIEIASEMIKDVMNQTVRPSPMYGGFNQQQPYRPRGPIGPNQWGPRGPHSSQPMPYDGQHRGPYPHFSSQYPPPNYANYPPQMGPRSNYGSSWEQRNPPGMRGPHGGGYDYYGSQGGHASNRPVPGPISYGHGPSPSPAMGPPPPQANYNYGQQHSANYGPYSRGGTPHQSYGHGYDKPKYDNPTATQPPYGNANSQPFYPQTSNQAGYGMQPQQYGRPPSYSMPSQGPPPQLYVANQAGGEVPYQAPAVQASQSYGSNVPPHQQQQQYPTYASSAAMQAPYGAASGGTDGYNQMPPASNASYPQQAAAAAAYGQVGGQQSSGYMQGTTTSTAGYGGAYTTTQQGYAEQSVSTSTGYGAYQDPTYAASVQASGYGAQAASGQQGYAQAAQGQANYDQSVPQQGAYGSATGNVAAVNYGKTVSPQAGYPQYDTSQMYGGAAAPQTQ